MSENDVTFVQAEEEIDLWHYASKYYDPVKAREYYLRTRELKGRQGSGEELSKESRQRQAEAKSYVRDQIRTERSSATKANAEAQTARLEKLREDAKATRDRIVEGINTLVEKLKADLEVEIPKPSLNEIPPTASPRQRAFLQKQNDRMMKTYNSKVQKAETRNRKTVRDAQETARAEIKKVGTDLKDAVTKARTEYSEARKALAEKYKTDLQTELQNIEDQVR